MKNAPLAPTPSVDIQFQNGLLRLVTPCAHHTFQIGASACVAFSPVRNGWQVSLRHNPAGHAPLAPAVAAVEQLLCVLPPEAADRLMSRAREAGLAVAVAP